MLKQAQFARLIDSDTVAVELDRLGSQGPSYLDLASTLSRRINGTVDWNPLGSPGARYALLAMRGEAVVFLDRKTHDQVVKLRGREEHGFDGGGFGCVLGRNKFGWVDFVPGTLDQALERERLTWLEFEFGCTFEDVVVDESENVYGLLLAQPFIKGSPPTQKEIRAWMESRGWQWQGENREISPRLNGKAWLKNGVAAFDTDTSNFIRSDTDGLIYPIDLIVWPWPET